MTEYHKIHTIFKRDMSSKKKSLLVGQWAMPEFEYLANNEWVFTEKVDGTNIRIMLKDGKISFGGRTDEAQLPMQLVQVLNSKFLPLEAELRDRFTKDGRTADVCFYGEGYGAKIQKIGGNYRSDQNFVLFDIRIGDWWLERGAVENIALDFGIDVVPIIGTGNLHDAIALVQNNLKSTWGDFEAEGIVARPKVELRARSGPRIITKIKGRDFK